MATVRDKYNILRGKLDNLGYNQPLSRESTPLVEALLSQLLLYKEKFIVHQNLGDEALHKCALLEQSLQPLNQENEYLINENNFYRTQIIHIKEEHQVELRTVKDQIGDLENAYSDLEFANMELLAKIGALEQDLFTQNKILSKYEGLPANIKQSSNSILSMKNTLSQASHEDKHECGAVTGFRNICSVNNYLSDVFSQKSPSELNNEIVKLKKERMKLEGAIEMYKNQVRFRDEEIKRLCERDTNHFLHPVYEVCTCHLSKDNTEYLSDNVEGKDGSRVLNSPQVSVQGRTSHRNENLLLNEEVTTLKSDNTSLIKVNADLENEIGDMKKEIKFLNGEILSMKEKCKLLEDEGHNIRISKDQAKEDRTETSKGLVSGKPSKIIDSSNHKSQNLGKTAKSFKKVGKQTQTAAGEIRPPSPTQKELVKLQCDCISMKEEILRELEQLYKKYLPAQIAKSSEASDNEKLKSLSNSVEQIKAERDYYCREYHCLQEQICNKYGSLNRNSPQNQHQHHKVAEVIQNQNKFPEQVQYTHNPGSNSDKTLEYFQKESVEARREIKHLQREIVSLRSQISVLDHNLQKEKCQIQVRNLELKDALKCSELEKRRLLDKQNDLILSVKSLENSNDSLNRRIQELISQNSNCQSQYNHIKSVNEHIERSTKNVEVQLYQTESELDAALKQIKSLQRENKDMLNEVSQSKIEKQETREKLLGVIKEKDNIMEKLDEKAVLVCKLEKENSKKFSLVNQLEDKITRLTSHVMRSNTDEMKSGKELMSLKKELEVCLVCKNELTLENRKLLSDLEAATNDVLFKASENESYKKEIANLKETLQNYVEEVRRVEQILEDKETEREQILDHYQMLNEEALNLESSNQSLENERKWTSKNLQEAEEKLHTLESAVQRKDSMVSDLEEQILQLTNEVYQLRSEQVTLKQENYSLKNDLETCRGLCDTLENQKQKYLEHMRQLEDREIQFKAEIDQMTLLKEQLESQLEADNEKIHTLERAIAASRKEVMEESLQGKSLNQKLNDLQSNVGDLQEQLWRMNDALSRTEKTCTEYQSENLTLKRQLTTEQFGKAKAEETLSYSTSL